MRKFLISTTLAVSLLFSGIANAATGTARLIASFNEDMLKEFVKDTEKLQPGDTVVIYIDSRGGLVYIESALRSYIKLHGLQTVCEVGMFAASAAAQFLMHCNYIKVADDATIMFHLPFKEGPKGEKVRDQVSTSNYLAKYGPTIRRAMTKDQYEKFVRGEDVSITGAEFKKNIGGK